MKSEKEDISQTKITNNYNQNTMELSDKNIYESNFFPEENNPNIGYEPFNDTTLPEKDWNFDEDQQNPYNYIDHKHNQDIDDMFYQSDDNRNLNGSDIEENWHFKEENAFDTDSYYTDDRKPDVADTEVLVTEADSSNDFSINHDSNNTFDHSNKSSLKNNLPKIALSAIVILAAVFIVAISIFYVSNKDVKKVRMALEYKDAGEVISLYNEACYNSPRKAKKMDAVISEFVISAERLFNDQCWFNVESMGNMYDIDSEINFYLSDVWGNLFSTPDEYNSSLFCINNGNASLSALESFKELIDSRTNLLYGIYRNSHPRDLYSYKEAMDYFSKVSEKDIYGHYAVSGYDESIKKYIAEVMKEFEIYTSNGDISGGVDHLNMRINEFEDPNIRADIEAEITKQRNLYADNYDQEAKEKFNSGDYEKAAKLIGIAVEIAVDKGEYKAKLSEYKKYVPLNLYYEKNVFQIIEDDDFRGTIKFNKKVVANNNKEYKNCLIWYNNGKNIEPKIQADYLLNGKYVVLSGTILLPKAERDTEFTGYFKIYGDGKLLYKSPKISGGFLTKDFSCNVKNVKKLSIKFYANGEGGFVGTGPDFAIYKLVAKTEPPKKISE